MRADDLGEQGPHPTYRRFIYLDRDEVLAALSAVQGGELVEAIDEFVQSGERNAGLAASLLGQGVALGGKSSREMKRGFRRTQTDHAAVNALLHALRFVIRRLPQGEGAPSLEEGDLVQFATDLSPVRSKLVMESYAAEQERLQGLDPFRRWWALRGHDEKLASERAAGLGHAFITPAAPGNAGGQIFLIETESKHLRVDPDLFARRATVVGQIVAKPGDGEHVLVDSDENRTFARIVNEGEVRAADSAAFSVPASSPFLELPDGTAFQRALVLRPLCVYRGPR